MPKRKTLPKFKNIEEEANFWDTHSIVDYVDFEQPLKLVYKPKTEKKETMTIRVAPSLKKEVEKLAQEYDISTSSLIRMWMVDRLREALSKDSQYKDY